MFRPLLAIPLAVVVSIAASPLAAHATSITVTTTADELNADGDCSLREAVQAANGNAAVDACPTGQSGQADTIVVPAGTYTLMLAGSNDNNAGGDLDLRDTVTITGAGAATTIIQACDVVQQTANCPAGHGVADRVFHVIDSDATISGVTVRHGRAPGDSGHGIFVHKFFSNASASLTLTDAVVTKNGTTTGAVGTGGGGLYTQNATLVMSRVTVTENVASGSGSGNGGGVSSVGADAVLEMTDCLVSDNEAGNHGGGLFNDSDGTVTVTSSTISGNRAILGNGGGFLNRIGGTATFTNCTVSGNEAGGSFGGGIQSTGSILNLRSCTITMNHLGTGQGAGGIDASGVIVLRNTIVAGNTHANTGPTMYSPDCESSGGVEKIVSEGHNLVGEAVQCPALVDGANGDQIGTQAAPMDPGLAPLADNGGPTPTHALLANSLALDAGNPATPGSGGTACPATDQRGEARPSGIGCDTGAVELAVAPSPVTVDSVHPAIGGNAGTTYTRVLGSGFAAGALVTLVRPGFADVVGTTTNVRASAITATLDLTGVAPGVWSVRVRNPDDSTATLTDAYTIQGGGGHDLWSALILPRAFVEGRTQTIYVQYGNRGLNDAHAVPLWLSFPDELEFHVQFPRARRRRSRDSSRPIGRASEWTRRFRRPRTVTRFRSCCRSCPRARR